jgi:hypothetical protein
LFGEMTKPVSLIREERVVRESVESKDRLLARNRRKPADE